MMGGRGAMPDVVLFDGRVVPTAEAVVPVADRAVLYGESLFETVKVVDGAPCLWKEHVARLAAGCGELGLPLDLGALEAGVRALLAERPVAHGVLRVQVTGGVQPGGGRGLTAPVAGRRASRHRHGRRRSRRSRTRSMRAASTSCPTVGGPG